MARSGQRIGPASALGAAFRAALVSLAAIASIDGAHADGGLVTLRARPSACVVLHRGQTCEGQVEFTWHTPAPTRYCLRGERGDAPLACWHGGALGRHVHAFSSARAERFAIHREGDRRALATVRVKVEWVYRASRRGSSAWRMF